MSQGMGRRISIASVVIFKATRVTSCVFALTQSPVMRVRAVMPGLDGWMDVVHTWIRNNLPVQPGRPTLAKGRSLDSNETAQENEPVDLDDHLGLWEAGEHAPAEQQDDAFLDPQAESEQVTVSKHCALTDWA